MTSTSTRAPAAAVDPDVINALRWRCIGPHRGGRSVAVAGDPNEPMAFYFGACSGGVWKTTDGGLYWENISDGFFNTGAVGAIAVSESDPNVIYAGTGEACIRGNVSHGDGVYKSADAGKTWKHVGLSDTRHIARVRIHPTNPDLVYVAALGHAFGANDERGVFRSSDGGATWEKVLYRDARSGAADLTIDPNNPRIMFATIWETIRQPWHFSSGGDGSGIFRSTDGGDSWSEISDNPGLPEGVKGRMGVAASPARSGRVWAVIEASDRGLFRSDDGGDSWEKVSDDKALIQRPWYYCHVFADPKDAETVYVLNLAMHKSVDGGKTFETVDMPHGDNHDLWIDPENTRRMIEGNDGGACVSFNGGESWSTIYNQPTAQIYRMTTDNQFPYRVYGTQQDNSAISVPSNSDTGAIRFSECYVVGSSESGQIAVKPDNPNVVFSGAIGSSPGGGDSMLRYDHGTRQTRIVTVWPEFVWGHGVKDHKYRFQWTYPIVFSPHDPNVLYAAGNVVFKSEDEGSSWEQISPDLTRNDPSKMEASGGPLTLDTTFVEHYCTIFSFLESPNEKGVFWAGSDDGLVHISKDGGKSWDDVTPPDLPEWTCVAIIEASPHDPATVYVAAHRYKLQDNRPLLFKTSDYGKSWTSISDGIPDDHFTRVIRADTERPGLLYAGTETDVYVSFDDGGAWQSLRSNLPIVPVHDLTVKGDELVAATHGRSFWILDNLTLLRQLADDAEDGEAQLFKPADALRWAPRFSTDRPTRVERGYSAGLGIPITHTAEPRPDGTIDRKILDGGENKPEGAAFSYFLADPPESEVRLTILNKEGDVVNSYSSTEHDDSGLVNPPGRQLVSATAGMNTFQWNLRHSDATRVQIKDAWDNGILGPLALPGEYEVRLEVDGEVRTQPFEIVGDPRVSASQSELDEQLQLIQRIQAKLSETHSAINRLRRVRGEVEEWVERATSVGKKQAVAEAATTATDRLTEVESGLVQVEAVNKLDRISHRPGINAKLAELVNVVSSADAAPTKQSHEVFEKLDGEADVQLQRLQEVLDKEVDQFVDLIHELEIPAVTQ